MKKFGYIKKSDIYICGTLVGKTSTRPMNEKDIFCKGKNESYFAYDLDNLILIKYGDYYINLEAINSYMQLENVKHSDEMNHTYQKNRALSKEALQKIVDENDPMFDGSFFVVKDNLLPYDDKFANEYGMDLSKDDEFVSFRKLKELHERSIYRRNGIDNLIKDDTTRIR